MPPSSKKLFRWTLAAILAFGIFLRVWVYSHHESFWKDEVGLASNFLTRDLSRIHEPLQGGQAAPIGFCQLSKLSEMALGHDEHVFWLLPLIAGIGMLFLAAGVFRKQLPNGAWLIMLAVLAFDKALITYSCIFKPYIVDAFCSLLMVGAFLGTYNKNEDRIASGHRPTLKSGAKAPSSPFDKLRVFDLRDLFARFAEWVAGHSPENNSPSCKEGARGWVSWLIYSAAGLLCLWLSYASVFVIAGLGLWQIVEAAIKKDRARFLLSLAANLFLAAVFLWLWQTNYRLIDSRGLFKGFWAASFAPLTLKAGSLGWYARNLGPTLGDTFGQGQWTLLLFLAAIGALKARRENPPLLALLLPVALTFAASWFEAYPIAERLALFWTPLLAPFIALGIYALWKILSQHYKGMRVVFALCVALPLLYPPVCQFFNTRDFQEIKQAALSVRVKVKPGDVVYLHSHGEHLYHYYFTRYPLPQGVAVVDGAKADSQTLPAFIFKNFSGRHLFMLYAEPEYAIDEISLLRAAAERNGTLLALVDLNLAGALELQVK